MDKEFIPNAVSSVSKLRAPICSFKRSSWLDWSLLIDDKIIAPVRLYILAGSLPSIELRTYH